MEWWWSSAHSTAHHLTDVSGHCQAPHLPNSCSCPLHYRLTAYDSEEENVCQKCKQTQVIRSSRTTLPLLECIIFKQLPRNQIHWKAFHFCGFHHFMWSYIISDLHIQLAKIYEINKWINGDMGWMDGGRGTIKKSCV